MAPLVTSLNKVMSDIQNLKNNKSKYQLSRNEFIREHAPLRAYAGAVSAITESINRAEQERIKIEKELEIWRKKLKEAMIKRKAMEILKEKKINEYKAAQKKKEQINYEEIIARTDVQMIL